MGLTLSEVTQRLRPSILPVIPFRKCYLDLQMRIKRLREVKGLAQGHTANKECRWNAEPDTSLPETRPSLNLLPSAHTASGQVWGATLQSLG